MSSPNDKRSSRPAFRTTRLFSIQLGEHDTYFQPRRKRQGFKKWARRSLYAPAFVLLLFPSFQLGALLLKTPGTFEVPEQLERGALFTIPANDEIVSPQANGHPLHRLEKPNPVYIGAAIGGAGFNLTFGLSPGQTKWTPKRLVPKLKHPSYPVYSKFVRISDPVSSTESADELTPSSTRTPVVISEAERAIFERQDGQPRIGCMKEPSVTIEEPKRKPARRPRNTTRSAKISLGAPGEVAFVSSRDPKSSAGQVVVVYHGGGFFSRYHGLRNVTVRKGEKVRSGAVIGALTVDTKKPAPPPWTVYMGEAELKAESLLALSSRLCDST